MKDGRTHLAYKAQHALDTDSEIIVAATIHHPDTADSEALKDAVVEAEAVLVSAEHDNPYEEVVADKGYHKTATLAWLDERGIRSYIPQPRSRRKRKWSDKPASWQKAYRTNRRRVAGPRLRALQRKRSERAERSFAHTCGSGAARRTWLRGVENIKKRYVIHAAARNLGTVMRRLFGVGTPRAMQRGLRGLFEAGFVACRLVRTRIDYWVVLVADFFRPIDQSQLSNARFCARLQITASSTGC